MLCEECGVNAANVHLTQIVHDETQVFHLCEACARKKGFAVMVDGEAGGSPADAAPAEEDKTCGRCSLKLSEFRAKGWLGCPSCYDAFGPEIEHLFVQVHGSSIHKGKKYTRHISESSRLGEIDRLRTELAIAIQNEEFEQAAAIRDAIHHLKGAV